MNIIKTEQSHNSLTCVEYLVFFLFIFSYTHFIACKPIRNGVQIFLLCWALEVYYCFELSFTLTWGFDQVAAIAHSVNWLAMDLMTRFWSLIMTCSNWLWNHPSLVSIKSESCLSWDKASGAWSWPLTSIWCHS